MRILLVEDDEYVARAIMARLKVQKGLEIDQAYDGFEALDMMTNGDYDLILLDIILPGMNGLDALEKARKKGMTSDVFVISNLSGIEHRARAKDLGVVEYFEKINLELRDLLGFILLYARA